MDDNWDYLLSEFRRLGGVAENICQKEGEFGRGIFSHNPNARSSIYTPAKLMIKQEDIYLESNKLRIKKDKEYCQETRDFFNFYQDNFSWGRGGKEKTESFEQELNLFSSYLKKLIKKYTLVDLKKRHEGNWNDVIKNQFLNARVCKFSKDPVIVPVWDLVNHEVNAFPFVKKVNGLSTPSYAPRETELTQSYGHIGTVKRCLNYGFFCKESVCFSLPFNIKLGNSKINLICKGLDLMNDKIKYKSTNSQIIIDGLPIASVKKPSFIKNYFSYILELNNLNNAYQDLLPKIIHFNCLQRKEILAELSLIDNSSSRILSRAINYELHLLSHV